MSQKEFTFGVTVMPRKEVLDTQGRAVEETLRREGEPVVSCRVGRYVELKVKASAAAEAEALAGKISEGLLSNSLIETFELKLLA
jgi:phosphoribosylformylglycinamidine (FGAM) synthase PurS component